MPGSSNMHKVPNKPRRETPILDQLNNQHVQAFIQEFLFSYHDCGILSTMLQQQECPEYRAIRYCFLLEVLYNCILVLVLKFMWKIR